ncbi:MAG: dihydroneopterin aldolase [Nitrospiria bacterium]
MDKLTIYQIEFHGHCGITEAERSIGQRLSVDIEMHYDLKKAAKTDHLEETVDYDDLSTEIAKLGRKQAVNLIETLAESIAWKVLENSQVHSVLIRLKKISPPCEAIRGGVVVECLRTRP